MTIFYVVPVQYIEYVPTRTYIVYYVVGSTKAAAAFEHLRLSTHVPKCPLVGSKR